MHLIATGLQLSETISR